MQADFHYYATYCAAYLAGYSHEEALALWSRHAEEYSAAADSSTQELEPSLAAFAAASPAADEEDDARHGAAEEHQVEGPQTQETGEVFQQ